MYTYPACECYERSTILRRWNIGSCGCACGYHILKEGETIKDHNKIAQYFSYIIACEETNEQCLYKTSKTQDADLKVGFYALGLLLAGVAALRSMQISSATGKVRTSGLYDVERKDDGSREEE